MVLIIFLCSYWSFVDFWRGVFLILCSIIIELSFHCWVVSVLYIFYIHFPYRYMLCTIFLDYVWWTTMFWLWCKFTNFSFFLALDSFFFPIQLKNFGIPEFLHLERSQEWCFVMLEAHISSYWLGEVSGWTNKAEGCGPWLPWWGVKCSYLGA